MSVIAQETHVYSNLVKQEYLKDIAYCNEVVTANEAAAKTYAVGTILGKVISGGTATAVADTGNTGTGAFGAITVTAPAKIGTYRAVITTVAGNAGTFLVVDPDGKPVGTGTVAVAFSKGGLAFTLADATDFVIGDGFNINVVGSYKYKIAVETATDGSNAAAAVALADQSVAITTDTKVLALVNGPLTISKTGLVFDATYNNAAKKEVVYSALKAMGFQLLETV